MSRDNTNPIPWDGRLVLCGRDNSFSLHDDRVSALAGFLKNAPGSKRPAVFGLNAADIEWLSARDLDFLRENDFESGPYLKDVNAEAIRMALEWPRLDGVAAILAVEGINTGECLSHPVTYFLLGVLRDIALLDGLLREKTAEVYACDWKGRVQPVSVPRQTRALFEYWYGLHRPEAKNEAGSAVSLARQGMGLFWRLASPVIRRWPGRGNTEILLSSDLKHVEPVRRVLRDKKRFGFTYLRDQYGIRQWRHFLGEKIPFYCISGQSCGARPERIEKRLAELLSGSGFFNYRNFDFFDTVKPHFMNKFLPKFSEIALWIPRFMSFLKKHRIRAILADEDVCPFNKTLLLAANRLEIASAVIQHGAPFKTVPIALAPVTASAIAAWGETSRELLLEHHVPEEKIHVTGVPRYDSFHALDTAAARAETSKNLGLDLHKKWIVLAVDPFHEPGRADFVGNQLNQEDLEALIRCSVETVNAHPDWELIIKLHPRDRYENFAGNWLKRLNAGNHVRLLRTFPTPLLVSACDVVLVQCSTVAIEAMMMDKPVILVNLTAGEDIQPHAERGAALRAVNVPSLEACLMTLLYDKDACREQIKKARSVLSEYIHLQDGKSSERAANLMESLISGALLKGSLSA